MRAMQPYNDNVLVFLVDKNSYNLDLHEYMTLPILEILFTMKNGECVVNTISVEVQAYNASNY